MLSGTRKAAVGVWLGLGLAVPAVHRGGERACALGSTRVGAVIKPQEKGVDAGLGEQPGSRHPALGIWFAKSRTAGSWPDRRAILVLHCPGGCLSSPEPSQALSDPAKTPVPCLRGESGCRTTGCFQLGA